MVCASLRRHPLLLAILLVSLLGLGWMRGWFGTTVAFRSIMHDALVGRNLNQYTPQGSAIFLITSHSDADALVQYLQLLPPVDQPPQLVSQLRGINFEQELAILVLQGVGGSSVQVERVQYQWRRVLIDARFLTPGWGAGQPAVQTDAYDLIAIPRVPFEGTFLTIEAWDWWHSVATTSGQIGEPPRRPATPTMPPAPTGLAPPPLSRSHRILTYRNKTTPIAG